VSRRGTCDRGIWTKPLAWRTRCAMGFAWVLCRLFVWLLGLAGLKGKGFEVDAVADRR